MFLLSMHCSRVVCKILAGEKGSEGGKGDMEKRKGKGRGVRVERGR